MDSIPRFFRQARGLILPGSIAALALLACTVYLVVDHSNPSQPAEPEAFPGQESSFDTSRFRPDASLMAFRPALPHGTAPAPPITTPVDCSALMNFALLGSAGSAALLASREKPQPEGKGKNRYSTLHQRARQYQPYVERHSERFQVCRSLIYAIIKVESDFDQTAVSPASAFGLMQLVPESGGRAAYRMVYGSDEPPTRDYLEDPDKNIELGTAYLRLLARDYFSRVEDSLSREYCQIAAYNTGAGNVLKAFSSSFSEAIVVINSLSADEVYEHLVANLPYQETRNYLPKVLSYQREFASL